MIKKRDLLVIATVLVAVAALALISRVTQNNPGQANPPVDNTDITLTQATHEVAEGSALAAEPEATPEPAETEASSAAAFLMVTVRGMRYEPIALTYETEFSLAQQDTGAENVIHVTEDSIWMASSTCDNQDCVEQGAVSIENRDKRFLYNMIVCLPNEVLLELLTPEEAEEVMREAVSY